MPYHSPLLICVSNKILSPTHCSTGNLWSSISTGHMWSCFRDNVTSLVSEFNVYCRRCICYLGRPNKSVLQLTNLEVTKAYTKVLALSVLRNFLTLEIDLIEWKPDLHVCSICLSKLILESRITPMFLAWSVGLRLALQLLADSPEREQADAWHERLGFSFCYHLMQVVVQHPGIDTIDASLQLEFGFIKITSIRSLERTVRLCVVSILIEGDFVVMHYVPKWPCLHCIQ